MEKILIFEEDEKVIDIWWINDMQIYILYSNLVKTELKHEMLSS